MKKEFLTLAREFCVIVSVVCAMICFVWSFFVTKEFTTLIIGAVVATLIYRLPVLLKINWDGMSTALLALNVAILSILPKSTVIFDYNNPYVALTWCIILIFSIFYVEILFKKILQQRNRKNKFFSWVGFIATVAILGYSLYYLAYIDYSLSKPLTLWMIFNIIPLLINTDKQYQDKKEEIYESTNQN